MRTKDWSVDFHFMPVRMWKLDFLWRSGDVNDHYGHLIWIQLGPLWWRIGKVIRGEVRT